ncbi:MAG: hypothetical protein RJA44_2728, partial [Pseudomonadota bacterium]
RRLFQLPQESSLAALDDREIPPTIEAEPAIDLPKLSLDLPSATVPAPLAPQPRPRPAPAVAAPAPAPAPAAGRPAEPLLDPAALARLRQLDPTGKNQLLQKVLKAFVASIERLQIQLQEGMHSADGEVVRQVAHTLKSSSASIGAMRLSGLCTELENQLRQGAPYAQVETQVRGLQQEMLRVQRGLLALKELQNA